ncbi:MAG TPA: lysophospholipid acyltransferase family protein [Syntrophomonadaceae bacterium]|nr:lysophospholipid acyltransferase family protein [Syntrophomonadaceae bacterium]
MLYAFACKLLRFLFYCLGLKTEGVQNLPATGPVIIAANHVSNWDPIVVGISFRRPIHFMAKNELFVNPFLGKLLTKLNAFPIKRGTADRGAIRKALQILEEGEILGIFPEGERKRDGKDTTVHAGIAMLALKSGAPILPVACIGSGRNLPLGWFNPLIVRVGEPIILSEYQDQKVNSANMEKISIKIMCEINTLLSK